MTSKMIPAGARRAPNEGLEAFGAPLGTMWAQSGRQERVKSHFKAEVEAMLGGQNCLKSTKSRKKSFQTRFSKAKKRKITTLDPFQERVPEQH